MTAASKLRMTAPAAAGAFDPVSDMTWHSLYWAEGTDFVAQGYSDTDPVGTWPNETSEKDATEATNTPTYDASNALFNGQPVVQFPANKWVSTANFTTAPTYPISIVMVAAVAATNALSAIMDSTPRNWIVVASSNEWGINAGSYIYGGTSTTGAHLFVAQFDGSTGNDTLDVDGTNQIDTSAGSNQMDSLDIGGNTAGTHSIANDIAFLAIFEGDVTADGSWADFETWVTDHYGITIA